MTANEAARLCQFCTLKKIARPAYATAKLVSVGSWFDVCREHFVSMRCELGPGLGRVIDN